MKKIILLLILSLPIISFASNETRFFYKLNKGESIIYLYGTAHMGTKDFFPLNNKIYSAIDASEIVAVETDGSSPTSKEDMNAFGLMPVGFNNSKLISSKNADLMKSIFEKASIPHDFMVRIKPGLASIMVPGLNINDNKYSADYSVDDHIINISRKIKKPIVELEGARFQYEMYDGIPQDIQIKMLNLSLEHAASSTKDAIDDIKIWDSGSEERAKEELAFDFGDKDISKLQKEILMTKRNANMTNSIELLAKSHKTIFAAVGFLHMIDKDGLVESLKKSGYSGGLVKP
jgi:uncharacterized protein YbaP (TraB family)